MALTRISSDQIEPGSITAELLAPGAGAGPVIANVQVANSSYSALDDTAVALDGGYIILNGSNFGSNTQVIIGNSIATSVTYVSSTEIRAQVPAKSAGSYIVYLVNTDTGATAIRVNAVTYSGTPTWSTDSTLTEGAVDEAISIQLDATSDTSVTYQLQTGSTLPSGLTLAANGLLSGTVTGLNEDTLYNFTIEAVDAENQDSPRAFSITITAGDQNINSVVLALNADTNTFITDASTNSFAITPNGDTRPSAFSPYNTNWSNYFDGTGDYLSVADNAALRVDSGDFTIEFWINFNSIASYQTAFSKGYVGPGDLVFQTGNGNGRFIIYASGSAVITESGTATVGEWVHYALVRNSTTLTLYRNGVSSGSVINSTNLNSTVQLVLGAANAGGGGSTGQYPINGYMSNVRIVKGTAVYTSAFTPPVSPLTAISGTSLLTCQSSRLIDNSTNNFTITRNGDVKVTSFGPFTETDTTTGSGYFDGTGDYLTSSGLATTMGTGDFTIECWAYIQSFASYVPLITQFQALTTGAGYYFISFNTSRYIELYYDGQSYSILNGAQAKLNEWTHVAVSRSGSTIRAFVNGVLAGSVTFSGSFGRSGSNVEIGGSTRSGGTYYANAYISDVRAVIGTAVYTEAFTPPTSPLTAISNTSLLTLQNRISYNNSQPVDESGVKNIITRAGNASVGSYTPHTPAGWSAYFGSSTSNIVFATNAVFAIGTGNFTVEGFVNFAAWSGTNQRIFLQGVSGTDGIMLGRNSGSNDLLVNINTTNVITYSWNPNIGQWYHLAVVREGTGSNQVKLYIDGSLVASGTSSASIAQNQVIIGGLNWASDYNLRGYASSFRYSKISRNISLPTVPFSSDENTLLLTPRGPSFTDDGPNRFAITRNGDTRITPFSPFKTHTIVPDSHSVYFDGSGDSLTLSSNLALTPGAGDFSIECWIYPTAAFSTYNGIFVGNATGGFFFGKITGGIGLRISATSDVISATAPSINQWTHIAITRSGTSVRLFYNGIQQGSTVTNSTNFVQSATFIGENGGAGAYFPGYISNLRFVKGTALYTSNFTPSTTALTNIANTSLLTCQSSTVIDNSNNAFAITVNGNAQPTKYNPFGETFTTGVQYSPASHGGSYYFDGTGDRIDTPSSLDNSLGTSNFTLEFWFNPAGFTQPTNQRLIGNVLGASWGSNGWTIGVSSNNIFVQIYNFTTTNVTISTSTNILLPQWYHIALTRNGSIFTLFVNGVSVGTYSSSGSIDGGVARALSVGGNGLSTEHIAGYISGVRLVKGTALYTSAFVPPAAPPSPVAGTTLLLNGTNAAVSDGLGRSVLETIGTAKQVSDTKKFGTGSMYIPAITAGFKTDGVNLPGNFTIEFWVLSPITGGENFLIVQGINATNGFLINATRNAIRWRSNGTADIQYVFPTNNTNWYHVAIVRNGSASNNVKVYYDGNSVVSGTYTNQILASAGSLHIGPSNLLSASFSGYGYIDDLRITKGVARYTSNFTPPTSSFKLK